jgi:hypothetical protein
MHYTQKKKTFDLIPFSMQEVMMIIGENMEEARPKLVM